MIERLAREIRRRSIGVHDRGQRGIREGIAHRIIGRGHLLRDHAGLGPEQFIQPVDLARTDDRPTDVRLRLCSAVLAGEPRESRLHWPRCDATLAEQPLVARDRALERGHARLSGGQSTCSLAHEGLHAEHHRGALGVLVLAGPGFEFR